VHAVADQDAVDVAALVRDLYSAAPSDFVAERKRLAATLKAAGDKEAAAAFAKLRKPSVIEDALNRTARSDPDAVAAWASAVEAAEAAQSAAIGGGDAGALRAATADLRAATAAVVKAATRHAGAAKALDLGTALQGLMTEGGVDLFRHGVLGSAEPGQESELFAGAPEPPARRPAEPAAARPAAKRSTASAERSTAAAEPAPGPSSAERRASAQAVKRHAAEVAKATRAHEIAAREVERLTAELAQAQKKLLQTERALGELQAAAPT
jgi:hypothetical protein